jgi:peptidoglycan biosynthesis protein MviN/MurJ (putative lipid II flippase)
VVQARVSLYKAPVIKHSLHALVLGALAATAVDFGFRAAFIGDSVAYAVTAYTCALVAFLVGRTRREPEDRHWSDRVVVRIPVAVLIGAVTLLSLRSWAMWHINLGRGTTTGHSPYIVLPLACVLTALACSAVSAVARRRSARR